jgi:hypothetical protein
MKLEDAKGILDSLKANPMAIWGLIFAALGTIGTVTYNGITYYNEGKEMVTSYGDTASTASAAKRKVDLLEEKVLAQQEAIMKLQERSSDALISAREAKMSAESTQREVKSLARAQETELKALGASMNSQLNSIKRATTNRLGN